MVHIDKKKKGTRRFPIMKGTLKRPAPHRCAWCKRGKICEPNSFADISCGAMLVNRKTGDGGPNDKLDGYLCLTWHGAHTNEGGKGDYPDIYKVLNIAWDIKGGQIDIVFCSTNCLRAFLNHAVDQLEEKVAKESDRMQRITRNRRDKLGTHPNFL